MNKLSQGLIGNLIIQSSLLGINYYFSKEHAIRNYLISMVILSGVLIYLLPENLEIENGFGL